MVLVVQIISIVSFVITIGLGIVLWFKRREIQELEMRHKMEIQNIEHKTEKETAEDRIKRLEDKVEILCHKASGRHSEVQARLLTMEIDLKIFITEQNSKVEQIFGIIQGRRSADKQSK